MCNPRAKVFDILSTFSGCENLLPLLITVIRLIVGCAPCTHSPFGSRRPVTETVPEDGNASAHGFVSSVMLAADASLRLCGRSSTDRQHGADGNTPRRRRKDALGIQQQRQGPALLGSHGLGAKTASRSRQRSTTKGGTGRCARDRAGRRTSDVLHRPPTSAGNLDLRQHVSCRGLVGVRLLAQRRTDHSNR